MKNKQTEKQMVKAKSLKNQPVKKTKRVTEYIRGIPLKPEGQKLRLDIFLGSTIFN